MTSTDKLMTELAKRLSDEANQQNGIERGGQTIRIPEHMDLGDASKVIADTVKAAETEEEFHTVIECHPNDGLVAFNRAMTKTFGKLTGQATMTMFGKQPPQHVRIEVDYGVKEECVIGHMQIPGVNIDLWVNREANGISLHGECKRKFLPLFRMMEEECRRELKENSIYKGKAIDSEFQFLDIGSLDESIIVYPPGVEEQLQANVWTPITHAEKCRSQGIPAKRGVLLHGPYGTGKTLTALKTARRAVENGWTFINVKPGESFTEALETAKHYQPAVVFVEDIDSQTDGGRTNDLNSILETFDGLVTKSNEIMVVLTTNHVERINRAMLRPGRLDSLIEFGAYDEEATARFIQAQVRNSDGESLLEGDLDSASLYAASEGFPPAFLAEGVRRAKVYALARGDDGELIRSVDIEQGLSELRSQFEIMVGDQSVDEPEATTALRSLIKDAVAGVLRGEGTSLAFSNDANDLGERIIALRDED